MKTSVLSAVLLLTLLSVMNAQPNILLIIADDLGNDAIEGFGIEVNNYPNTPTLNTLREKQNP